MFWSRNERFCFLLWVVLVDVLSGTSNVNETSLHSPGSFLQGFRRWFPVCGTQRNVHFRSKHNSSIGVGMPSNNMTRRDKGMIAGNDTTTTATSHNHTWSVVSSEALWHFVGLNRAAHHHTLAHAVVVAGADGSNNRGNLTTTDELAVLASAVGTAPGSGTSSSGRPLCDTVKQLVQSISLPVAQHTCQVMMILD